MSEKARRQETPSEIIERITFEYGEEVPARPIIEALAAAGFKIMARDPAPAIHTAGLMAPPPKLIGPGGDAVIGWKFADELYKLHWDAASPSTGDHGT